MMCRILLQLTTVSILVCNYVSAAAEARYNWQPVNGLHGGACRDIVVRGDDAIAVTNGGLFYSENRGAQWNRLTDSFDSRMTSVLILSDRTILIGYDTGMLCSVDTTRSELVEFQNFDGEEIMRLYETDGILFVGTQNENVHSIWRYDAAGDAWERAYTVESPGGAPRFSFAGSGAQLLASFERIIVSSTDSGKTWEQSPFTPEQNIYSVARHGAVWYLTLIGGELLQSIDGAQTWNNVHVGEFNEFFRIVLADDTALYAATYSVAQGRVALHRSADGGAHWEIVSANLPGYMNNYYVDQGDIFVAGSVGIYQRVGDNDEWLERFEGIQAVHVNCFARSEDLVFAGSAIGVLQSNDDGVTWENIGLKGQIIRSLAIFQDRLYAATDSGVYRYDDATKVWAISVFAGTSINVLYVNPDVSRMYLGKGSAWLAVTYGVFHTDNGLDWQGETLNGLTNDFLSSVDGLAQVGSTLYAATDDGFFSLEEGNGNSWKLHPVPNNAIFRDIVLHRDTIYLATFDRKVLFSADWGSSFTELEAPPQLVEFAYTHSFTIHNHTLYLAASDGLFTSAGQGNSWKSAGLDRTDTRALSVGSNSIVIGTGVNPESSRIMGIYRSGLPITSVEEQSDYYEHALRITPNPALERVRIALPADVTGQIRLDVYTLKGVAVDGNATVILQGNRLEYTTTHLPSGTYIIRVKGSNRMLNGLLHVVR